MHEVVFTKYFEDKGYKSDSYVDLSKYRGRVNNSSILLADELLIQDRCPLLKRRAFIFPLYLNNLDYSISDHSRNILNYIENNTDYDLGLIWQDLLQTTPMSLLRNNMNLMHVHNSNFRKIGDNNIYILRLPKDFSLNSIKVILEYLALGSYVFLFSDITDQESIKSLEHISNRKRFKGFKITSQVSLLNSIDIVLQSVSNLNLDVNNSIVTLLSFTNVYNELKITEEDFVRFTIDNLIFDDVYNLFKDPFLGLLLSAPTSFGKFYLSTHRQLNRSKDILKVIYDKLGLSAPFDLNPLSNGVPSLVTRLSLLIKIYDSYKILQCNELNNELFFSQIFPLIIQNECKYTKWVISTYCIQNEFNNYNFMRDFIANSDQYIHSTFRDIDQIVRNSSFSHLIQAKVASTKKSNSCYLYNYHVEQGFIYFLFHVNSASAIFLRFEEYSIPAIKYLKLNERLLVDFYKSKLNIDLALYRIPLNTLLNKSFHLEDEHENVIPMDWRNNFPQNNIKEFLDQNLFAYIWNNSFYLQTRAKFLLNLISFNNDLNFNFKDRVLTFFSVLNPFKCFNVFAENEGANDNAFQLFKYAQSQSKGLNYYLSNNIKSIDPQYRDKVISINSWKYKFVMFFAKRLITSFTYSECFPSQFSNNSLFLSTLRLKWFLVPHGMYVGKSLLTLNAWGEPYKLYACNEIEAKNWRVFMSHVTSLGFPRMDKWALTTNSTLNSGKSIFIFFTWRKSFRVISADEFKNSSYFLDIKEIVRQIIELMKMDNNINRIYYCFHHELVRREFDKIIKDDFVNFPIDFVYYNDYEEIKKFNVALASSNILLTDLSSISYDFAYKPNSLIINYINDEFVSNHYQLNDDFNSYINVQKIYNRDDVVSLIYDFKVGEISTYHHDQFFAFNDAKNSKRVYEDIVNA